MKPVDAHCHLDFERFDEDREEVINRAREKLEFVVNAGCNLERNRKSLELQRKFPDMIIANLGLHPTFVDDFDDLERIKDQIREEDPAAIGEIGLDHHHVADEDEREMQRKVFVEMLELAEELDKPIVVHTRNAEQEAVEILKTHSVPQTLLHCFNGSPELAAEAAENNMKIGVTTQVLYSSNVQSIVEELEVKDIMVETDSPFLYPDGRNEPVHVIESSEKIAEIKEMSREDVIRATTNNAEKTFR